MATGYRQNRSYTEATGHRQKVSSIGDVFTVTSPRYFFRCAVCGKRMKPGEKALRYVQNFGYATDHVHEGGCHEKYEKKYTVQIGKVPAIHAPAQFLAPPQSPADAPLASPASQYKAR